MVVNGEDQICAKTTSQQDQVYLEEEEDLQGCRAEEKGTVQKAAGGSKAPVKSKRRSNLPPFKFLLRKHTSSFSNSFSSSSGVSSGTASSGLSTASAGSTKFFPATAQAPGPTVPALATLPPASTVPKGRKVLSPHPLAMTQIRRLDSQAEEVEDDSAVLRALAVSSPSSNSSVESSGTKEVGNHKWI